MTARDETITLGDCSIETRWILPAERNKTNVVFLHEGLGSVSSWAEFPALLCQVCDATGLMYSRAGHGSSLPLRSGIATGFLEQEALETLPRLLDTFSLTGKSVLYGHSDGATIALIFAAHYPVQGLILEAPHVFLEQETIAGISAADASFGSGPLRTKLERHHDDATSLFESWRDTWRLLSESAWNVIPLLEKITCPVLLIQGDNDAYGTLAQIRSIETGTSGPTRLEILPNCGHVPHREQRDRVIEIVKDFLERDVPPKREAASL